MFMDIHMRKVINSCMNCLLLLTRLCMISALSGKDIEYRYGILVWDFTVKCQVNKRMDASSIAHCQTSVYD